MRRTLPSDNNPSRSGRSRNTTFKKKCHPGRLSVRWNSIGALSCSREACSEATTRLCCMYRLPVDEPSLPIVDTMLKHTGGLSRSKLLSSDSRHSSLIDLPTKHVKVCGANLWKFDVFSLKRQSSGQVVYDLGMHLFEIHGLFHRLRLSRLVVMRTLTALESAYWEHNPYHTAVHAADVMQALHCFISQPKLLCLLSPVEILASLLAAACHDADHPGVNQMYLERTENFLVNLYNSTSVLEQHHARYGLSILHQSGLVGELSAQDWSTMRECIVKMVHATDMAYQGFYRDKFTEMLNASKNNASYSYTPEDRILLLQITLKCADISNPCRPWESCRQWAYRICSEFFGQGDQERLRWSLVPSIGCDRHAASVPRIQMAFVDNLIRPLFTKWHEFFRSRLTCELMNNMDSNYMLWKQELITGESSVIEGGHSSYSKPKPTKAAPNPTSTGNRVQRKGLKSKLAIGKKKKENKAGKQQNHNVTFQLEAPVQGKYDQQVSLETNNALKTGFQTFFITTRGIRRHSLPETQGAIKKTFDFALFKKSNAIPGTPPQQQPEGFCGTTVITSLPSLPNLHFFHVNKSTIKSLRTASGNILQTLCEEIISQEPKSDYCRAFDLDPFPLPEAWNVTGSNVTSSVNQQSTVHLTGLTINLSVSDFIALAHRRSSVPLLEK
ncbi:hypothetical protein CRM22_004974 [Opisthorchis felineus]|uniref:PDEase domain-containing protein n=1 Tax=Opisthorchis felineus TaxID=147828 RepID=A0A4S2LZX2_OPIFE|nr:hypothetical protein CRM22_004974 [Opisthorchis felineus]TGZ67098.1 hypothetical protein CRM22_004974 [Opisthorchis felineus]TGZ67099.1 hypothetical protein CRM22_004974 [Opisthorchis felineus]